MNMCTDERVKLFLDELEDNFPQLEGNLVYEYIEEDELWDMSYNVKELIDDLTFLKKTGELLRKYFYNDKIFNVSFGYKPEEILKETRHVVGIVNCGCNEGFNVELIKYRNEISVDFVSCEDDSVLFCLEEDEIKEVYNILEMILNEK